MTMDSDIISDNLNHDFQESPAQLLPDSPTLGKLRPGMPEKLHVLGDLHGWAPGLINYLIHHRLAEISIDGTLLGKEGKINKNAMNEVFGRNINPPIAGLRGLKLHEDALTGPGIGPIKARWIDESNASFVQIGDIFDRADYSEIAAEILRQLIIDAPNRVFVLVGNHEQFMIENSLDNWLMNEERNAINNYSHLEKGTEGKHTRFLPTALHEDWLDKAKKAIFPCYRNSVFTLFLTQAAAQQKSKFIDRKMNNELVEKMLSLGWIPYLSTEEEIINLKKKGTSIPGAMTALVIGDNLLHHAEPGIHLINLPDKINWLQEYNIGWIDYTHGGGSIQGTEDSPYLWSRGASSGAYSGTLSIANELNPLRSKWPGLFRIIHGHSPTISVDEFRTSMGAPNSTTCSYFAHKRETDPVKGLANNIRIYNVDEAMSPVYYKGDNQKDDILRTPIGLRISTEATQNVTIHNNEDKILSIESNRSMRKDTYEFWKWSKGEFRLTAFDAWNNEKAPINGGIINFSDINWILKAGKIGTPMLQKRISGYNIISNLILDLINKSDISIPDTIINTSSQPPVNSLKFIKDIDGNKIFLPFFEGNPFETASNLELIALGFSKNGHIITINCTDKKIDFFISGDKSSDRDKIITTIGQSIKFSKINMTGPTIISLDGKFNNTTLEYWLDKKENTLDMKIPSISYWSESNDENNRIKTIKEVKFSNSISVLKTRKYDINKKEEISNQSMYMKNRQRAQQSSRSTPERWKNPGDIRDDSKPAKDIRDDSESSKKHSSIRSTPERWKNPGDIRSTSKPAKDIRYDSESAKNPGRGTLDAIKEKFIDQRPADFQQIIGTSNLKKHKKTITEFPSKMSKYYQNGVNSLNHHFLGHIKMMQITDKESHITWTSRNTNDLLNKIKNTKEKEYVKKDFKGIKIIFVKTKEKSNHEHLKPNNVAVTIQISPIDEKNLEYFEYKIDVPKNENPDIDAKAINRKTHLIHYKEVEQIVNNKKFYVIINGYISSLGYDK